LTTIIAPSNCPSCGFSLEWENDQLFCYNPSCKSKTFKTIQHFAQTLKIKGLGPSTIEKLNINSIPQIYELSLGEMVEALNSEKLATKLFQEIQDSKRCSLLEVLPAFSIPLIGKTASEKLCGVITSIYEVNQEVCQEAGLGPKAIENLLDWYRTKFLSELKWLPFSFEVVDTPKVSSEVKGVVCISGKLVSFKTKAEAEKALLEQGYVVKSSMTKEVTILVNESGVESSKTKKARENGLSIISNLNQLIGH
jgi:NAD-dependent DNA ligase